MMSFPQEGEVTRKADVGPELLVVRGKTLLSGVVPPFPNSVIGP